MRANCTAIPTSYSGVLFRSSNEARFAKWCDANGLQWNYEPEGFQIGSIRYLPDFYIPSADWIVEVKPPMFLNECYKIEAMRKAMPDFHYVIGTMNRDDFEWIKHSDAFGIGRMYGDNHWETPTYICGGVSHMWYCRNCARPFFPTGGGWSCPHCGYYDGGYSLEKPELPDTPLAQIKQMVEENDRYEKWLESIPWPLRDAKLRQLSEPYQSVP